MQQPYYLLTKWIWTDSDFPQMGWHDATVHAYAAIPERFELVFDIDYILSWEAPIPPKETFSFWVAPATLVFEDAWDVEFHLTSQDGSFDILDLQRSDEQPMPDGKMTHWLWHLQGGFPPFCGDVTFRATGYKQYIRRQPFLVDRQALPFDLRGGVSFKRGRED